jgi:hypothetical protein
VTFDRNEEGLQLIRAIITTNKKRKDSSSKTLKIGFDNLSFSFSKVEQVVDRLAYVCFEGSNVDLFNGLTIGFEAVEEFFDTVIASGYGASDRQNTSPGR